MSSSYLQWRTSIEVWDASRCDQSTSGQQLVSARTDPCLRVSKCSKENDLASSIGFGESVIGELLRPSTNCHCITNSKAMVKEMSLAALHMHT